MTSTSLFILASIFVTSLVGSWHCALMCGGFSYSFTSGQASRLTLYHLGRMLSYTALGGVAGKFGEVLLHGNSPVLRIISFLFFFLILGFFATSIIRIFKPHLFASPSNSLPQNFLKNLFVRSINLPGSGFFIGVLTVFLPCGWLYGFLLAAASSGSLEAGALTMFVFWLGGLPALTLAPIYFRKSFQKIPPRLRPALESLVIFSALLSWSGFYLLT